MKKTAQGSQDSAPACTDCDWKQKPGTKNPIVALAAHERAKHPASVDEVPLKDLEVLPDVIFVERARDCS